MSKPHILAVAMDHTAFLKDSDGNTYSLSHEISKGRKVLQSELDTIADILIKKSKTTKIIFLSDILTPYCHPITVEAWWWFYLIEKLIIQTKRSIKIIRDRGTLVPLCGSCLRKSSHYFIKYDKWVCPHCKISHDTTDNTLNNILRDYAFHTKHKPKQVEVETSGKNSHLRYLFSTVSTQDLPSTSPEYEVKTDKKTTAFVRNMDRVCRRIRSDINEETKFNLSKKIEYKGWVDEWMDRQGKLAKYRATNKFPIASLSISDTIISICDKVNKTKKIENDTDEMWVVYWRNVFVDRETKRLSLPRMRGKYFQLPNDVVIPKGFCYVQISAASQATVKLRFVIAGNLPPKEETLDGIHHRGRHRRNTRTPRVK